MDVSQRDDINTIIIIITINILSSKKELRKNSKKLYQ